MNFLRSIAKNTEYAIIQASRFLNVIGMVAAGVLMLLITFDVIGRFFFNHPIPGTVYISQYVLVIAVYCSVAHCTVVKSHIKLEMFVSRFSERSQTIINIVIGILNLGIFSLLAWRVGIAAMSSWARHEVSRDSLRISVWPFKAILVIGVIMLCLVLLSQLVHLITSIYNRTR